MLVSCTLLGLVACMLHEGEMEAHVRERLYQGVASCWVFAQWRNHHLHGRNGKCLLSNGYGEIRCNIVFAEWHALISDDVHDQLHPPP